jgi:hypothetical protein
METQSVQNEKSINLNHDEIAAKAYQIWETAGRQEGFELKHWLQAEQELREATSVKTAENSKPAEHPAAEEQKFEARKPGSTSRQRSNGRQEQALAR